MIWILIFFVVFLIAALLGDPAQAAENTVTLQDSLVAILQQVQSGVSAGVDFLQAELPDVIRQLLLFHTVIAALAVAFGFILLVSILIYWILFIKKQNSHGFWRCEEAIVIGAIGTPLFGLAGVIFICANLQDLLKLTFAPKLWLIEYAATLIK